MHTATTATLGREGSQFLTKFTNFRLGTLKVTCARIFSTEKNLTLKDLARWSCHHLQLPTLKNSPETERENINWWTPISRLPNYLVLKYGATQVVLKEFRLNKNFYAKIPTMLKSPSYKNPWTSQNYKNINIAKLTLLNLTDPSPSPAKSSSLFNYT